MDCRTVRDGLMQSAAVPGQAAHLEACPECAALARRLALAREVLSESAAPAALVPDASFALRVVERLPRPAEVLGWAALRALPAALVLVLALLWIGVSQAPPRLDWTGMGDWTGADLTLTDAALAPEAGH